MGGGGSTTTVNNNDPWKPAQASLERILADAEKLYNDQGGINAEWIDKELADLTPDMQNTIKSYLASDGAKSVIEQIGPELKKGTMSINTASGLIENAAKGGNDITTDKINKAASDLYQSDLVKSQKEQLAKDVKEGLAGQIQGLNQQAVASGNMGSSRAGVAEGVATGKAAEAIATGGAQIENAAIANAYQQAQGILQGNQQAQLSSANTLGSLGLNQAGLGMETAALEQQRLQNALTGSQIGQNYTQAVLDNKWFNAQGEKQAGWDNINRLLGVGGSIGALGTGGSSTTTGGADQTGQYIGAAMMMAAMMMSDARFKDDLELVEEERIVEFEGKPYYVPALYRWKWNEKAMEFFNKEGFESTPAEFGVIAQELEEIGLDPFVVKVPCDVEGMDGEVRIVNYAALYKYAESIGVVGGDEDGDVQA